MFLFVFLVQLFPGIVMAQAFKTPARSSELRANLLDALRPLVAKELGQPIEFVVETLRVSGNAAFADVMPQRPGGGVILNPNGDEGFDGVHTEALYLREGNQWVVMHMAIGATDVWWADPALCREFSAVIPEVCP